MIRMLALGLMLLPSDASAAARTDPNGAVMRAVKAVLTDPDSAKFRDVRRTGEDRYCGWVNSKNRMGGYAGDQLFFDEGGFVQILDETSAMEMTTDSTYGPKIKPCISDAPSLRSLTEH